jgi:hypothetical protein
MKQRLVLLFALMLLAAPVGASRADDPPQLAAAEIINKHLAAVGGKEALTKFKTRVALGTVKKENEADAKMAIMSEAPNRVSAMYIFQNYTWQMTNDKGKVIFRPTITRDASVIEVKYHDMLLTGAMFNSISLYSLLTDPASADLQMEAKGIKKVKGRQAYVVEVKRGKMEPVRLFFDTETFMWVRTEYGRVNFAKRMTGLTNDITARGEEQTEVDFFVETSDFKVVDGVKLPFKFEQTIAYPLIRQKKAGTITGVISEYRHNVAIQPEMFQ